MTKPRKTPKATRTGRPPDSPDFESFYEVSSAGVLYVRKEKLLDALALACSAHGYVRAEERRFLEATAASLHRLRRQFQQGDIAHLEDGLGLSRPPKWSQKIALTKAGFETQALLAIASRLNQGAKAADVFDDVAELGRKRGWPRRGAGASSLRDLWYDHEEAARDFLKTVAAMNPRKARVIASKRTRTAKDRARK